MENLKNRDYVVIGDKSGSMTTTDCPGTKTRWDYMKESTLAIVRKICEFDPDGITLTMFATKFKSVHNVTAATLENVFKEHEPMGSTILAPVLRAQFNDFDARRKANTLKPNGEILLVVTDGRPDDEAEVIKELIRFGNSLDNPDSQYGISFIQIGKDPAATAFLNKLDNDLVGLGAKHDIVDTKTIDEVEEKGLVEVLTAALTD